MFFLFAKTILVEIYYHKNYYFIGENKYSSIPTYIMQNAFNSSNWNRALKFKPTKEIQDSQKYNYMLEIDFYLDKDKIIPLCKDYFFYETIISNEFTSIFMPKIIKHYFKHSLYLDKTVQNEFLFLTKYKLKIKEDILRTSNLDDFVILDNNFDLHKKRFKKIFIMNKKIKNFKWIVNEKNQLIYYVPQTFDSDLLENSFALDLQNKDFFINFKSLVEEGMIIEGTISESKTYQKVLNHISLLIQNSHDKLRNWHLYNLTGEISYIHTEMSNILNKEEHLKSVSKLFKQDYTKLLNMLVDK